MRDGLPAHRCEWPDTLSCAAPARPGPARPGPPVRRTRQRPGGTWRAGRGARSGRHRAPQRSRPGRCAPPPAGAPSESGGTRSRVGTPSASNNSSHVVRGGGTRVRDCWESAASCGCGRSYARIVSARDRGADPSRHALVPGPGQDLCHLAGCRPHPSHGRRSRDSCGGCGGFKQLRPSSNGATAWLAWWWMLEQSSRTCSTVC
jgi:hypothetical protein